MPQGHTQSILTYQEYVQEGIKTMPNYTCKSLSEDTPDWEDGYNINKLLHVICFHFHYVATCTTQIANMQMINLTYQIIIFYPAKTVGITVLKFHN